jgi:hypothetical protein
VIKEMTKKCIKMLGFMLGIAIVAGAAVFLYWYQNFPHHPTTFANTPFYPGATNVQPNPGNNDLYKEFTVTTTADFGSVKAFYEKVLTDDSWVAEAMEPYHGWVGETKPPDERRFTHKAHKDSFHYVTTITSKGLSGGRLLVELKMICVCLEY